MMKLKWRLSWAFSALSIVYSVAAASEPPEISGVNARDVFRNAIRKIQEKKGSERAIVDSAAEKNRALYFQDLIRLRSVADLLPQRHPDGRVVKINRPLIPYANPEYAAILSQGADGLVIPLPFVASDDVMQLAMEVVEFTAQFGSKARIILFSDETYGIPIQARMIAAARGRVPVLLQRGERSGAALIIAVDSL
jgi:hypothetical protein